jgi:hypothetical protein
VMIVGRGEVGVDAAEDPDVAHAAEERALDHDDVYGVGQPVDVVARELVRGRRTAGQTCGQRGAGRSCWRRQGHGKVIARSRYGGLLQGEDVDAEAVGSL